MSNDLKKLSDAITRSAPLKKGGTVEMSGAEAVVFKDAKGVPQLFMSLDDYWALIYPKRKLAT